MQAALIIVCAVVAMLAFSLWVRSRTVPTLQVRVDEIPRVLASLSASSSDPTFAVFMFTTPDLPTPQDALNIQFSMESGKPGFDWVLIAPRNIRDHDRFVEFAQAGGYHPEMQEMNNVRYLRVEQGDLAALCRDVITKMYSLPESELIDLIVEGFEWQS
jgi:hypothetical protein